MPRTLPSGIAGAYTQGGAQPGYLLRIYLADGVTVLRLTTLDQDFLYGTETYLATDVFVPDISFDGTVTPDAQVVFGDMDLMLWTLAQQRYFDDARIEIDHIYAGAPNEAIPFFRGRCGKLTRKTGGKDGETFAIDLDAEATAKYAPRERVQYIIDSKWLLPAGNIIIINGQKWVIDRPTTSNT